MKVNIEWEVWNLLLLHVFSISSLLVKVIYVYWPSDKEKITEIKKMV